MSTKNRKPIPINIISGPLGVGKTTTINHLMELRPPEERWAILVNEYGLVGLDAALMQTESERKGGAGVEIREVAGGCICCSAGFMFEVSLVFLLQRRPDRLLIEPTGLAAAMQPVTFEFHQAEDYQYEVGRRSSSNWTNALLILLICVLLAEQALAYSASYHPARGGAA